MPFLDVSDVLDDPDFADTINVTRLVDTISDRGRTETTSEITSNVSVVVTAATGDTLELLPDGARAQGAILVHSRFRLTIESDTTKADIVTWAGRDYTVTSLNDWSRFGSGFVQAVCTLRDLQEASPE